MLRHTDNTFLVLFRILFGTIAFVEAYFTLFSGLVHEIFITPKVFFPFIGFEWFTDTFSGKPMLVWYSLMGLAGLGIALGWKYRLSATLFALLWTGSYLMQKTHYNNHFYLEMLLSWLMPFLPAHRRLSLDSRHNPELYSSWCPKWCLWLFITQVAIVYSYAGIAKINHDWINIKPISIWFDSQKDYWLIGALLQQTWFRYLIALGGIFFDLLVIPALLWHRTRRWAFGLSIFFHLSNAIIFQIGSFPFTALSFSVFFFPVKTLRKFFFMDKWDLKPAQEIPAFTKEPSKLPLYLLYTWALIQVMLPLRHHLWEGNVSWTEEGHRLSWRMMLRSKSGYVRFRIVDPQTRTQWTLLPIDDLGATANDIAHQPDMCWQYVQYLKKEYEKQGIKNVQIYASGLVSLNGRPFEPLYDENVDLAKENWEPFHHAKWINQLKE